MDPSALAAELWNVDQAMAANAHQRQTLLNRRQALLDELRRQYAPPPQGFHAPGFPSTAPGHRPPPQGFAGPQAGFPAGPAPIPPVAARESSPRSVQNLLLGLGGLLLAVAAVVFTVVAWGRFGLAGRAAILLAFTAVALGLPAWLVRRKLPATAETVALVGLVLMGMDAYAARAAGALSLDQTNGYGYAAVASALLSAVALCYPILVPCRLMRPAGLFIAQLPLPLAAVALHADASGVALAATLALAGNLLVPALSRGRAALAPERWIAGTFSCLAALVAIPLAASLTFLTDHPARPAAVLALAGLLTGAATALVRAGALRALFAGVGVLQVAAAAVGALLPPLGGGGVLAPACAGLLIAALALVLRSDWRRGSAGASWVLLGAGGLSVLRPVTLATVGPFFWLVRPWTGAAGTAGVAGADARAAVSPYWTWSDGSSVLAAAVVLTVGAVILGWIAAGRRPAIVIAAGGVVLAAATAPVALDLSRPAALIGLGILATACCLTAALFRRGLRCWAPGAAGLSLLSITLAGSLAERASTLVAVGAAAAVLLGSAVAARRAPVGAVAAGLFSTAVAAEVAATVLASGGTGATAAWALLVAAAVATVAVHVLEVPLPMHARALGIGIVATSAAASVTATARQDRPALLIATAGVLVVLACGRRPRGGERETLLGAAGLPLLAALVTVAPAVLQAYLAPYSWLGTGWGTAPQTARDLAPGLTWSGDVLVPAVLAVVAIGVTAILAALAGRIAAARFAVPAAAITAGLLPLAFDLPWPVALVTTGSIGLALLASATAARDGSRIPPAVTGPAAAMLAGTTVAWSLATAPATVLALSVLAAGTLLAAVFGRTERLTRVAAVVAAAAAILDGVATALAAGLPAHLAAFAALAVAAGLAAVTGLFRRTRPWESVACEAVAAAGGLLGVALTAGHPLALSLALAVAGLAVGATALREDRRWAGLAGTALLIASSWVRLADIGITAPEAYTVAPAAVALVLGGLRRRHRGTSSWAAYGPGLAAGLLPSLAALFVQPPDALRPLVLGGAALLVLLAGAWWRLQAPLLVGAGVLGAVATHELAPAVAELVGSLPRWVPLATAGLLLLLFGATYEQRRRDLRRIRQAVSGMA